MLGDVRNLLDSWLPVTFGMGLLMRHRLAISLVMIVMAVASTWPLATRLGSGIPKGSESSPTVPIFNLWTVGWNLDRVWSGWKGFWDAPHFAPTEKTLALSEPLIVSQVFAGLAGLPLPAVYNLLILSAISLNAGVTWLALRRRRVPWPVALLASLAMARLPFVHQQLGLLQCVLVAGLIGVIHFGEEAFASGRWGRLWLAAASFHLTFLACGYYAVFLVLVAPLFTAVWLWPKVKPFVVGVIGRSRSPKAAQTPDWSQVSIPSTRKHVVGVMLGVVLLALMVPIALAQSGVLSAPDYERPRELIRGLSARPTDYLATPFPEWFQFVGLTRWHEAGRWKLSPGLLKVGLALVGVVLGLRSPARRQWTLTWLVISVSAFLGSLGSNFQIAGWSPYETLLDWSPTLARLRTPARMAVLVQIGILFLATEALLFGFRCARRIARKRTGAVAGCRAGFLSQGLVWLIGIAVCFEVPLPRSSFVEVPPLSSQRGWIDWLKNNTPEDAVIAHLPFPKGPSPRDYESEAWAMYWGRFHHRRMVNGFSGFFPASYLELKSQMQSFPDESSLAALRARGVGYCVVQRLFLEGLSPSKLPNSEVWEPVFQDVEAGVVLFRLRR